MSSKTGRMGDEAGCQRKPLLKFGSREPAQRSLCGVEEGGWDGESRGMYSGGGSGSIDRLLRSTSGAAHTGGGAAAAGGCHGLERRGEVEAGVL